MRWYDYISLLSFTITKAIPKKKNRWVFGAWFGGAISDNTKAISDYVENSYPEIEMIWITNSPEKISLSHGKAIKRNTLRSLFYIATARVAIMNQGYGDLNACNFIGGCFRVQLWHGVAWKKIFKDAMKKPDSLTEKINNKIFDYINGYDLYIAPSQKQAHIMSSAFGIDNSKILLCGQPRNAVLFSHEFRERARQKLFTEMNEKGIHKKIVVYMPTFRDKKKNIFSFGSAKCKDVLQTLEKKYNFLLIEKSHYAAQKKLDREYLSGNGVFFMPNENAEVLLAAADMLITDYSSCFFDFLITDRPIIHYIYDYEYYIHDDRGVYYDKESVICGDCPETLDQLWEAIVSNLEDPNKKESLRKKRRREYITFESSKNNEIVCKEILRNL